MKQSSLTVKKKSGDKQAIEESVDKADLIDRPRISSSVHFREGSC